MDTYRCVEVLTAQTQVETNLSIFDIASCKEELLDSKHVGAFDAFVEISCVAGPTVVLPFVPLIRHVRRNVENRVLLPARRGYRKVECRLSRLLWLLGLLLFLLLLLGSLLLCIAVICLGCLGLGLCWAIARLCLMSVRDHLYRGLRLNKLGSTDCAGLRERSRRPSQSS